jgi:hypothetical protein
MITVRYARSLPETAALRDFNPLFVGFGYSRPMRPKPLEHVCPLLPESGQIAVSVGMSAYATCGLMHRSKGIN